MIKEENNAMTFEQYIKNPSGKGSAVITNRGMYNDLYIKKFNLIMLREGNKFNWTCYKTKDGRYIIHIKVPSEVIPKFYYDVLIEFSPSNKALETSYNLKGYDIRVFSNSPDFMYTHCHAFVKNGLFFTDFASKMPKEALKKPAKQRNPQDAVSYVKSLYFAFLIMNQFSLFQKTNYVMVDTYNKNTVLQNVMSAEEKASLRQSLEQEQREKKKSERISEKRKQEERRNVEPTNKSKSIYTKKTSTVPSVKKNVYTRKAKRV